MGGINSLNGLSNVRVDFRPTTATNVQDTGNALRATERRLNDFLIQNCPSYFKRDYVHLMFKKPKPAS